MMRSSAGANCVPTLQKTLDDYVEMERGGRNHEAYSVYHLAVGQGVYLVSTEGPMATQDARPEEGYSAQPVAHLGLRVISYKPVA